MTLQRKKPLRRVSTGRGRLNKGKRGEREVVAYYRAAGFERAARSPGSGAMRPYGAGDLSPWPGDLYGVEPWLVEVKYDEKTAHGGVRTWPGSTFIMATLRDLEALTARHNAVVGRRELAVPVGWFRASHTPWRVFIPQAVFCSVMRMPGAHGPGTWVEIGFGDYFDKVVPEYGEGAG